MEKKLLDGDAMLSALLTPNFMTSFAKIIEAFF
jgi:hypothetical protein